MQYLNKFIILLIIFIGIFYASVVNAASSDRIFWAAASSLGVYDDNFGSFARDILEDKGWKIDYYNEKIKHSDVKFLMAERRSAEEDLFIIAISGTSSWLDVKTDLHVHSMPFGGNSIPAFEEMMDSKVRNPNEPLVHSGFITYVRDGFFTPNSQGVVIGEEIAKELKRHPQDKIYLTGHSLGGAVAELLAARLIDLGVNPQQIETITFGAPAVGNKAFVDKYEKAINLTRITLAGDVVKNLAQIGNRRFVQFKTNEQWQVPVIDEDKFAHSMYLYLDGAMRRYYTEDSSQRVKQSEKIATKEYYINQMALDIPQELATEKGYISLAFRNKYRDANNTYLSEQLDSRRVALAKAKALGFKYVVFTNLKIGKFKDSTSPNTCYLNMSRNIYKVNGDFVAGYSAAVDTKLMTLLDATMYLDYNLDEAMEK